MCKIKFIVGLIAIIFLCSGCMRGETDNDKTTEPIATIETKPVQNDIKWNGRGNDSGSDKAYVGLKGFIAVGYDEERELMKDKKYTYTPWQVPTYTRDKQFWNKTEETINHKEPVIVIEQYLQHEKYNNYSGYLKVERLSDGRQFFINVRNFVIEPYWTNQNVIKAVSGGSVIVTYHQKSEFYPVSVDNKKAEVPDGINLLASGLTGMRGKGWVDNATHQIEVSLSSDLKIYFNAADLTVSY